MQAWVPVRGYYLEPTKSILVVAPGNVAWEEKFFRGLWIKVVIGHCYLGGCIEDKKAEGRWLVEKITGWAKLVEILAGVSLKHPQSSYSVLQNSLQQEWAFVEWVNLGIGNAFHPVETALRETFVPSLFEGMGNGFPERGVAHLTDKQAGLAVPDQYQTAPEN